MLISGRGRLWGKAPKAGYHVHADKNGVAFAIGNQSFSLQVEHDELDNQKARLKRHRWYAKMLRKALKHLKNGTAMGMTKR